MVVYETWRRSGMLELYPQNSIEKGFWRLFDGEANFVVASSGTYDLFVSFEESVGTKRVA